MVSSFENKDFDLVEESDLDELTGIIKNTQSAILRKHFASLKEKLSSLALKEKQPSNSQINGDKKPGLTKDAAPKPVNKIYKSLTTYSCSFTDKKVKITLELPCEAVKDTIEKDVSKKSLAIRLEGANKNNYKFTVAELADEIIPEQFSFTLSNDCKKLTLTLIPLIPVAWKSLSAKAQSQADAKKKSDKELGKMNANLMQMMSDMYNSGDEKTKQALSEAWAKSQTEKAAFN